MLSLKKAFADMFNPKQQNKLPPILNQLLLTPGQKLAAQIKDGSLTSVKLCEAYIERIKQVNPLINAMCQERFKEALDTASAIDKLLASFRSGKPESEFSGAELELLRSPFLGVPVSVKESVQVKGMKNSCGLWSRRDTVASEDAVVVRNAKRFGMIPLCTSNVPECTLYWADCHNTVYGRSRNPHDLARITGASSGGEGALISAAASVMGIGSDIGGSLRIPAHFCGIFSHKPSPFLLSAEGNYPALTTSRLRLFTLGPMCRYASDLRPLLKCLMSDHENHKQDTYFKHQPDNIGQLRQQLLQRLDEPVAISSLKFYYCNLNESALTGSRSLRVPKEFMETQREILDHFRSKYNCQTEPINLDKYMRKIMMTWQCMLMGAGTADRDDSYVEDELRKAFGIDNLVLEVLKMPLGLSHHTKESLLALAVGNAVPRDKKKAYPLCEKFERIGAEFKAEVEALLGDTGVLLLPTMPSLAYKHNVALLKTPDIRFPSLFNCLQLPVSHAFVRLDRKHRLPYGFSAACKPYNDHICLAVAEEIEQAFGGWVAPCSVQALSTSTNKIDDKKTAPPETIPQIANNQVAEAHS